MYLYMCRILFDHFNFKRCFHYEYRTVRLFYITANIARYSYSLKLRFTHHRTQQNLTLSFPIHCCFFFLTKYVSSHKSSIWSPIQFLRLSKLNARQLRSLQVISLHVSVCKICRRQSAAMRQPATGQLVSGRSAVIWAACGQVSGSKGAGVGAGAGVRVGVGAGWSMANVRRCSTKGRDGGGHHVTAPPSLSTSQCRRRNVTSRRHRHGASAQTVTAPRHGPSRRLGTDRHVPSARAAACQHELWRDSHDCEGHISSGSFAGLG